MRLIVTGGGTGGHLFPGIAVATGMQQRLPGSQVMFIGTSRRLDRDALVGFPFAKESIHCMGLKGMGLWARLRSMLQLPGAVVEASGILKKFGPDLVLGVGGYVTGPVLLAAKMKKIPTCIHEQNSVPGLANRLAGKIADKVFISLPVRSSFPDKKTVQTGNPVRSDILKAAEARQKRQQGRKTILVLGGSQGAHRVNTLMLEAMEQVSVNLDREVQIIHQTGKTDLDM
ncbi:MAG: hypothetical protein GQ559_08360, partial [Desulfobulbaceae bacterium]|nr:hypothetical protein [Desulfobulbaceae bacterium]